MTSSRAWAEHNRRRLSDIRDQKCRERFARMKEGSHGEHGIILLIIVRFATQISELSSISRLSIQGPTIEDGTPFCGSRTRWEQACRGVPFLWILLGPHVCRRWIA
ncbi:hypothetical protein C8J56DRAFT_1170087 [Mycena floridula]|nr:hypothetical protein C8J56DRAFT_1170087 [Mycena floridula]